MSTVFANVVGIRVTPTELVLEFGSWFPNVPNQAPPADYRPEVRVVLNPTALPGLADALNKALTQAKGATAAPGSSPEAPKRPAGCTG